MNSTEVLTGHTARPVTFAAIGSDKVVRETRTFPAGTEVYVTETRRGTLKARVVGTLFTQEVYASAVVPA